MEQKVALKMVKVKIVSKGSLPDTLTQLTPDTPTRFFNKDFKVTAIRTQVSKLKKKGFVFNVNEKGLTDGCIVTRTK